MMTHDIVSASETETVSPQSVQAMSSNQQEPPVPPPKYPRDDLLQPNRKEDYFNICVPLYNASISGDWKAANLILDKHPELELERSSITKDLETALHVAASSGKTKFVKKLVNKMKKEDLELQNRFCNTALCLAALAGNQKLTEILVNENKELLTIPGSKGLMPLYMATLSGDRDTVNYLYDNSKKMTTGKYWTPKKQGWVLLKCVEANLYDVALKIVEDKQKDGRIKDVLGGLKDVLGVLARKPLVFNDRDRHFCRAIKSCIGLHVKEKESDQAMQLLQKIWEIILKELPLEDINGILLVGAADPVKEEENGNPDPKDDENGNPDPKDDENGNPDPKDDENGNPDPKDDEKECEVMQLLKIIIAKMPDPKGDENGNMDTKQSGVLFVAAEMGNTKFLVELIRQYPDLIREVNDKEQTIFHIAVSHRYEGIYNLLREIGSMKDKITSRIDNEGNNMLHLVGQNAKKNQFHAVSGYAFQMQWELLWFKEVEAMIPFSYREMKNKAGKTPRELFTENHKELVSKGEKWMKESANQCMVVAALIATIVFGVAFAIPGGYDQNTGLPMFISKKIFIAFVISDAISLIFSSASILIFLSILTSRFEERDFFKSLPQKLLRGLVTLFFSIVTMMVTFSLSFFVLYHSKLIWLPILICIVAAIPILYIGLHYTLLVDVCRSLCGFRYLFKPKKRMLYDQTPKFCKYCNYCCFCV